MTQISRVDQAIMMLKERLRRISERSPSGVRSGQQSTGPVSESRLEPIRQLARRKDIAPSDLRRAMVRTLLAESLGDELATTLDFEDIADRVTRILEENESGLTLLDRALTELG